MINFENTYTAEDPKLSIEDIDASLELQLINQARGEGPEADKAQQQIMLLSQPIIKNIFTKYSRYLPINDREDFMQDQYCEIPKLIEKYDPEIGRFAGLLIVRINGNGLDAKQAKRREIATLDDTSDSELSPKDLIPDSGKSIESLVVENQLGPRLKIGQTIASLPTIQKEIVRVILDSDKNEVEPKDIANSLDSDESVLRYNRRQVLRKLKHSDEIADLLKDLEQHDEDNPVLQNKEVQEILAVRKANEARVIQEEPAVIPESPSACPPDNPQAKIEPRFVKLDDLSIVLKSALDDSEHGINKLNQLERVVVQNIHLSNKDVERQHGIKVSTVNKTIFDLKNRLLLNSRAEIALWALRNGAEFDIPKPENLDKLNSQEVTIAKNIWKGVSEIEKAFGLKSEEIYSDIESIMEKTDAQNDTTIALLAEIYLSKQSPEVLEQERLSPA